MADRTERIQIQVSALAEFGQALSNLARLQQQGLDPATRSSARFSEEFRRITEVAQQVGSALRQTQAFAQGLGDTSATTALRFQRLSESLNSSQNALRGVENEYAASQVRLVQLNASLGDLQTRQQQANAALQQAERGSEAYEQHRRAVQELEAELRRVLTALDAETRAQNQLQRQANELAAEINQVNEALRTQSAQMQDTAERAQRLAEEQDRLNNAQTSFSGVMGTVSTGLRTVAELLAQGSNAARNFGVALLAGVTAPIIGLGALSTKTAATYDSLMRGLAAVSGGTKEAEAQFARLREVAKVPGLGLKEAVQGAINLQAAGLGFDQAERSLRAFGNALATVGKGKAELDGVMKALTDMKAKGKIEADEVRNQLAERVPQIFRVIRSAFGTSDLEALQKKGIGVDEFIRKITDELLKLPQAAGGAKNSFENLADEIEIALLPLGQAILPPLIALIENYLTPAIQTASRWFASLSPVAQQFSLVLGLLVSVIGPIALGISAIVGGAAALVTVVSAVASAIAAIGLPALLAAIVGIGVVMAEVATVAVGMSTAIYTAWKNNFGNIQGITAQVIDNVKRLLAEATAFWERNGEKIKSATMAVLKVGEYVVRYYAELLLPLVKQFADGVIEAVRIVLRVIEGAIYYAEKLAEAYEIAVYGIKQVFESLPEPVRRILQKVAVEAKVWVGVAYEAGKALGRAIIRGILGALTLGVSEIGFILGDIASLSPSATGSAPPQASAGDDRGRAIAQMEHDRVLARIPKTKDKGKPGGGGGGGGKDKASEFERFLEAAKILQSINDEALADMKQSADDAVKINADLIEREKAQVEAARAAGLIGAAEYYRSLANLGETQAQMDVARVEEEIRIERDREQQILAALEAIAAKRAELAKRGVKESADDAKARAEAERDLNAKLGDSKRTIQGLTTDLEIAQRKRQDAAIEGQRKVNQGLREEQKALDELEQQYFDLTATQAEKKRAAAYKEADAELDKIRPGLSGGVTASGDDPEAQKKLLESLNELERAQYATVLKIRDQKLAQIEFDERLAAIAEIQNRLKEQEANLDREALKLSISQYEVEARKKAMREGAAAAIEKEIAAMRALLSKNPSINNQQNRLSLEGAQRSVDDLRFNMSSLDQDLRQNLTQSFEGFFKNIMTGAQGAAEAFRGFVGSVLGGITQMIAKLLALWVVQKLVGFVAGAFGGGSLGGLGSGAAGAGQGAGSSIGSIASGVIGGGRAKGGDVREGVPYLVGEERPEIFVPGASGWIYPSVKDFAKSLMPRGLGGNLPMPQAANFKGGGNTTNEYLFATLFDKRSLQSLMKSKPLAQTIVQIVSENMNTIRKAGGF